MRLVQWDQILPQNRGVKVLFSALALPPHRDEIDANLAAVALPGDLFVDVEWVRKLGKYIVTLFREDIDNTIAVRECKTVPEVVEVVQQFVGWGLSPLLVEAISEVYEFEITLPPAMTRSGESGICVEAMAEAA